MKRKGKFKHTDPDVLERKLVYIPIIHTRADMGALSESVSRMTLRRAGRAAFKRKVNAVDKVWTEIEKTIDHLDLAYETVRLYQDGLPVCGKETEIVTDLANTGSRNHRLLLRLMARGATIMGTESAELLVEEYGLIKKMLSAGDASEAAKIEARQKALSDSLLMRRDQYIADRINSTLQIGETGIVFLGIFHSLSSVIDKDISVIYPINRPVDPGGKR
jgi:hypothetical protein